MEPISLKGVSQQRPNSRRPNKSRNSTPSYTHNKTIKSRSRAVRVSSYNSPFPKRVPLSVNVANSFSPSSLRKQKLKSNPVDMSAFIRIYRKTISNLKIREDILRSTPSKYAIGPTLIWTEIPEDLSIFTTEESYTNYIGFEGDFSNPRSPKYLKKILAKMRMTKGTILIKEAPDNEANAIV
jgi:hypothetical protein